MFSSPSLLPGKKRASFAMLPMGEQFGGVQQRQDLVVEAFSLKYSLLPFLLLPVLRNGTIFQFCTSAHGEKREVSLSQKLLNGPKVSKAAVLTDSSGGQKSSLGRPVRLDPAVQHGGHRGAPKPHGWGGGARLGGRVRRAAAAAPSGNSCAERGPFLSDGAPVELYFPCWGVSR